jgi:hypothetical protein
MRALIIVHSPTWFTELSVLGRYIHGLADHQVVFHFIDYGDASMQEFAAGLRRDGIRCVLECEGGPPRKAASKTGSKTGAAPVRSSAVTMRNRLARVVIRKLRAFGAAEARDFLVHMRELTAAIADARALARIHSPDVVVLGGDNPGYTTPALIAGFKQSGVPTVIVSSTMSNGLEEAAVYAGDPRYHVTCWPARLAAAAFPKWCMEYGGLRLLRCPVGRLLALEALRIPPPRPWVFNSGYADAIAMESQAMVDYYVAAGLPRDNVVLTGSPSDDAMAPVAADAPRLREELYAELGLPAGRPMLLTALVPDFLYLGRPQCDFQEYDVLVEFWVRSLAEQSTFNVVVALHPSVKIDAMRHIERRNVRIAPRRTAQLVPLCDLYVASVSSTIRWAIACGKPVINYDVYRYRYTDFSRVPGVIATEEQDAFRALIKRFAEDSEYRTQVAARQQAEAARWGSLEGKSLHRILELLIATAGKDHPRVGLAGCHRITTEAA